jgi:hypothetical protein
MKQGSYINYSSGTIQIINNEGATSNTGGISFYDIPTGGSLNPIAQINEYGDISGNSITGATIQYNYTSDISNILTGNVNNRGYFNTTTLQGGFLSAGSGIPSNNGPGTSATWTPLGNITAVGSGVHLITYNVFGTINQVNTQLNTWLTIGTNTAPYYAYIGNTNTYGTTTGITPNAQGGNLLSTTFTTVCNTYLGNPNGNIRLFGNTSSTNAFFVNPAYSTLSVVRLA